MYTTARKFQTKAQTEAQFKEMFSTELNGDFKTDKPGKRMAWNDFCDSLRKDGTIRPNSDWSQPRFIQS